MGETPPPIHIDLLYRPHEEIREIQNQRFRHQVALCFRAHPYYQEVFNRLKLAPNDFQTIDDVQKLPVTTKQDYLIDPEAFRLTALPEFSQAERTLWDVNYTTGTTTGIPAPFFNTTYDIFTSGESFPLGTREEMRQCLLRLGANKHDLTIKSGLGFTEMQGSTAECVEVGDEQSHSPSPDGKPGLLTITHLDRRGTVLLRYAIGDLTAISNEVCPDCGRQGPRIVTNTVRTFELVMFNGTLLNPDAIKEAVAVVEGVEEYQIVFTKERESDPSSPDVLLVRITAQPGVQEQVRLELAAKLTASTSMRPSIEFVGSRSEIFDPSQKFKPTRVIDLRPAEEA